MNSRVMPTTFFLSVLMLSLILFPTPASAGNYPVIWSQDRQLSFDDTYYHIDWDEHKHKWVNWTEVFVDFDGLPSIAPTSDNKLWLVWETDCNLAAPGVPIDDNIFYKIYDGKWSNETQLTYDTNDDFCPAVIQSSDNKIWVFWSSNRTGNNDIFYSTTANGGTNWSTEARITDNTKDDNSPALCKTADGKLWLVWSRIINSTLYEHDLYYKVFNGTTWSDETLIPTSTGEDMLPAVMQTSDERIWVFWTYYIPTEFRGAILYKTFDGSSWSSANELVNDSNDNEDPSVFQDKDGTIWVFWDSTPPTTQGTADVWYKKYNGATWGSSTQVTTDSNQDWSVSATQAKDKSRWVVWYSTRPDPVYGYDNVDLYYRVSYLGDVTNSSSGDPDGYINMYDLNAISRASPTDPTKPWGKDWGQWNPICDLNADNVIDVEDLVIAAINYGKGIG